MSKGIAKVIYDRYLDPKKIADLERQDKGVGDVAVARIGDKRFILYVFVNETHIHTNTLTPTQTCECVWVHTSVGICTSVLAMSCDCLLHALSLNTL